MRLAVAGPVIGMEPVRRIGIDDDVDGLMRGLSLGLRFPHGIDRYTGVLPTIKSQHGAFDLGGHVYRRVRLDRRRSTEQRSIERNSRLQMRGMRRVQPCLPAAA